MSTEQSTLLKQLPWKEVDRNLSTRSATALGMHFARVNKIPTYLDVTVDHVKELFASAHETGGQLPYIINYGQRHLEMTYQVFQRVGIDLPEVRLAKTRK